MDPRPPRSLETIRELHLPSVRFRISPNHYPIGASFCGSALARRVYVLRGSCAISIGDRCWDLAAGDVADLPEGRYEFRTIGESDVELVYVWELPPRQARP